MINTIMFDLDGTLLPMDTEIFAKEYFKELSIKLKDFFTPEEITKLLWDTTKKVISNEDDKKTNEEVFFEVFYENIKHDRKVLDPILYEFYEKDFNKMKSITEKDKDMIASVELLKEKGYELVVATNPLFPRTAILNRINWAGLNKEDFSYITSFEHMHFAKPNLNYYREILININKAPAHCIMVGNDVNEDMIASELGIKTYLIDGFVIGDKEETDNIDYVGDYTDFYNFSKKLPDLNK